MSIRTGCTSARSRSDSISRFKTHPHCAGPKHALVDIFQPPIPTRTRPTDTQTSDSDIRPTLLALSPWRRCIAEVPHRKRPKSRSPASSDSTPSSPEPSSQRTRTALMAPHVQACLRSATRWSDRPTGRKREVRKCGSLPSLVCEHECVACKFSHSLILACLNK